MFFDTFKNGNLFLWIKMFNLYKYYQIKGLINMIIFYVRFQYPASLEWHFFSLCLSSMKSHQTHYPLDKRREGMALKFVKNSLNNANFSKLFPLRRVMHEMKFRRSEKYSSKTFRYQDSAVPFLQGQKP